MKTYTIVLCGATGDLARRKIIPGLYDVMCGDPAVQWRIIGVAQEKISAAEMMQGARASIKDLDEGVWYALCEKARYIAGDLATDMPYAAIANITTEFDEDRLVYCATPSEFFVSITEKLIQHRVIRRQDTDESVWYRVAYEKPFGSNGLSAAAINEKITVLLNEVQIYRVDHYLAKKWSMALPAARMLDDVFNGLWQHSTLESLQVVVNESAGVGTRGAYYDSYGALKDMVQNHLLQAVSLLLLADPVLDYPELSDEKKKVLASLVFVDGVLGQYERYRDEPLVGATSATETFAALRLAVNQPQYKDTMVLIKTGKKLAAPKMVIYAVFKSNDRSVLETMPLAVVAYNDNKVALVIGSDDIAQAVASSGAEIADTNELLHAYGRILEFIIQGDKTIFVSYGEIALSWQLIDAIISQNLPLASYSVGSAGPQELSAFNERNSVKWIV